MSGLVPGLESGSVALALGAGLIAAVNPCGFALLPAYLSIFVLGDSPQPPAVAVGRALRATAALTAGFAAVFLAFGLAIAPVASSVQSFLPAFTVALGVVLAAVGLWTLSGRSLPKLGLPRRSGTGAAKPVTASWSAMTGFGASYAVASLGCTVAPFLAVVVTSFRANSPLAGIVLFVAYAAGMGLTVGTAAVAVALARRGLVTSMRQMGGIVPRISGLMLAAAGAYVAWYGAWELRVLHGGAGADPVVTAAGNLQRWLADTVEGIGAARLVAVLVAVAALALGWRLRTTRRPAPPAPSTATTPEGATMRMQAVFNGTVIAESDDTIVVEGNHYFPVESVNSDYLVRTDTHTTCPWKGQASYYTVSVDGAASADAAWYYPTPKPQAEQVAGRVSFWRGVAVEPAPQQP
jgi:uncharacterized protein (DUF427 family)/cytochrome c biogenesis protein CcdA